MSVKDEKIEELIDVLCFDIGLARVAREANVDTPVEEIQQMIDSVRANRAAFARVLEDAPPEIKAAVARLRAVCNM